MNSVDTAIAASRQALSEIGQSHYVLRETLPTAGAVDNENCYILIAYHAAQMTFPEPGKYRSIHFPSVQVKIDYPGYSAALRLIDGDAFGVVLDMKKPIGDLQDISRFKPTEHLMLMNEYNAILSSVVESGWLSAPDWIPDEGHRAAQRLSFLFDELSEQALHLYYAVAARPLLSWLGRAGFPSKRF